MASQRADDLNGCVIEVQALLADSDDLNTEVKEGHATYTVQAVVDRDRWHYHHISTP